MRFKPMPPVGRIEVEGPFQKKKEQRLNDALFLKRLADYFIDEMGFDIEAKKLIEIAKRLEK